MGQATVDLPDPLETAPGGGPRAGAGPDASSAASLVGADDLLSQLAGEEIDRLLAEAEVEAPPAERPATPGSRKPADELIPDTRTVRGGAAREYVAPRNTPFEPAKSADDLALAAPPAGPPEPAAQTGPAFEPAAPAAGSVLAAAKAEAAVEEPDLSTQLNAVFANLDADGPAGPPVAQSEPEAASGVLDQLPPALSPRITGAAPPIKSEELDDDTAAERAALGEDLAAEQGGEREPAAAADSDAAAEADDRVPLLVRFLEWLNSPLAACSEPTRELIGKLAIITLVNAVAVLLYVLIFR